MGRLVGIVGLAMALGSPLAGLLLSRMSPRSYLLGTSIFYVFGGTVGLYANSIALLLASRFLVGLSAAGFVIMAISLINIRLEGTRRARWMGIQVGLAMVSALAIHPISGALGESSWRLPFALFFLGAPLGIVALMLMERHGQPRPGAPSPTMSKVELSWYPWQFAGLALLIGSITYLPVVYGPFVMRQMGLTSPTLVGLVLTGDSLLGALIALAYGRSRKWLDGAQTFALSFAVTGIGTLIAALAHSLPFLISGMLLSGMGMGWLVPNLVTSLASSVANDKQAQAAGLTKSFHYIASPLCILAMEPIAARGGPQSALMATSLLSFGLLVLWSFAAIRKAQVRV